MPKHRFSVMSKQHPRSPLGRWGENSFRCLSSQPEHVPTHANCLAVSFDSRPVHPGFFASSCTCRWQVCFNWSSWAEARLWSGANLGCFPDISHLPDASADDSQPFMKSCHTMSFIHQIHERESTQVNARSASGFIWTMLLAGDWFVRIGDYDVLPMVWGTIRNQGQISPVPVPYGVFTKHMHTNLLALDYLCNTSSNCQGGENQL